MSLLKRIIFAALLAIVASTTAAMAQDAEPQVSAESKSAFNAGEFILGHIGDSYEWHICTVGGTHVTLPLPCILYSETSGLHVFCSSRLHHGDAEYEGFKISKTEPHKDKIVEMVGGQEVRPWDFSITKNAFALMFSVALICFIFMRMAKYYKKNEGRAPHGFFNAMEALVIFVRDDIVYASLGKKNGARFMPFLLTVFFFIFINNLLGLIPILPGGANVTGNIAVTCVLALFTFAITTFSGNKHYWTDIFWPNGVPIWLKCPPVIPLVELMGVFTKPFVLMVRLFANITAGHIIALTFYSLIFIFGAKSVGLGYGVAAGSILFTLFMGALELLVAFIQAYVFTLLSSIYFSMAVHEEPEPEAVAEAASK